MCEECAASLQLQEQRRSACPPASPAQQQVIRADKTSPAFVSWRRRHSRERRWIGGFQALICWLLASTASPCLRTGSCA